MSENVTDNVKGATPTPGVRGRLGRALRFLGWWFGFSALLGPFSSTCPFCGQPGCPGGAASAGFLGGMLAVLLFIPRWIRGLFKRQTVRENARS